MKIKSEKDFWAALMFIVTGIAFAAGALNYTFGTSARPGPAYFPFGLGVLQVIIGVVVLFESLTVDTDDGDPIGGWAWRPLIASVLSIAAFAWMLPKLGMVISLPVLIAIVSLANRDFKVRDIIFSAIFLTIASYLIFVYGLGLTIPLWPTFMTA